MNFHKKTIIIFLSIILGNLTILQAQEKDTIIKEEGYQFEITKKIKTTDVKNQNRSGTCWSFATVSFIESEILRISNEEYDLSEMYFVRFAYYTKAINYIRMHGKANFSPGGQAHDVINIIRQYGLMPEQVYLGLNYGEENHNHGELDAVLKGFLDAVKSNKNKKITPNWINAFNAVLDVYLGELPSEFKYNNKTYTSKQFAENSGLNPDDYVELTSYSHHPFYTSFSLEIPDNWSNDKYYNLPIDELVLVMDNAIENDYTIAWDGDVSDKGFSYRKGLAIVPEKNLEDLNDTEREKWEKLTKKEKESQLYKFKKPQKEKNITQEIHQKAFDNYSSTDDHLMHIIGVAKDQNGTKYYITKNSWAANSNDFGGYLNMSESYIRLNTIAIMIHKDAIPKKIRRKLGIK